MSDTKSKATELLMDITDMTRNLARSTAGAIRSCMLSDPTRPFCVMEPNRRIWKTFSDSNAMHVFDGAGTMPVEEFDRNICLLYKQPTFETREMFRIMMETAGICKILYELCREFDMTIPPITTSNNRTKALSLEEILNEDKRILEDLSRTIEPALHLFADSIPDMGMMDRDGDGNTDPGDEDHWDSFTRILANFHSPGENYPAFAELMSKHADNPELLELIRIDDALFVTERLLTILHDTVPNATPIINMMITVDDFIAVNPHDIGWSGGAGITEMMLRTHAQLERISVLAKTFLADSAEGITAVRLSFLAEKLFRRRSIAK